MKSALNGQGRRSKHFDNKRKRVTEQAQSSRDPPSYQQAGLRRFMVSSRARELIASSASVGRLVAVSPPTLSASVGHSAPSGSSASVGRLVTVSPPTLSASVGHSMYPSRRPALEFSDPIDLTKPDDKDFMVIQSRIRHVELLLPLLVLPDNGMRIVFWIVWTGFYRVIFF
jgi:hypothetical protein